MKPSDLQVVGEFTDKSFSEQGGDRSFGVLLFGLSLVMWFFLITKFKFDFNYWEEQNPLSQSTRFFGEQLRSIVHGRLDVPRDYLPGECFFREDKCFGYFGVTPSLIRLPLLFFGENVIHRFAAPLLAVALAISSTFSVLVFRVWAIRFSIQQTVRECLQMVLLLGPLSPLMLLTRVSVFHEAIAWCIAFACVCLYFLSKFWISPTMFDGTAIICALSLSVGANPSALVLLPVVIAVFVCRSVAHWKQILLVGSSITVSAAMSFGIFYLKFNEFNPNPFLHEAIPEDPFWASVMQANGGMQTSLKFLPSQIVNAFRIDSMSLWRDYPWVRPQIPEFRPYIFVWPVSSSEMNVQRSMSALFLFPFQVVLVFQILWWVVQQRQRINSRQWIMGTITSISILSFPLLGFSQVAVTSRYFSYTYIPVSILTVTSYLIISANRVSNRYLNYLKIVSVVVMVFVYVSLVDKSIVWL